MLEKHFFGEKKENNESFDLSNEVNLLKKDGDPRKKSYVLRLALESREYWHKFVGDDGKSYSPSIFRLFENEGLLDKKEDRTRKHMAPEHIEMVAKLFLLQFYLFGCVIVRLRKMFFAVAGLRPQNILLVFLASLENLKFRYEIVLQPSQYNGYDGL